MDLFEKSQQTLELPSVLELLAGEAVSEPAKEACRAVRPSVYRTEITQWLAETTAARDMMAVKGSPSFSGVRDVRGALARADMGGVGAFLRDVCGKAELHRFPVPVPAGK